MIEKTMKVVRISITDVLRDVLLRPEGLVAAKACKELRNGRQPSDEICLDLLKRRL